jgi:coproporphyrinogen III oxidase-like Fe-S oxidoreductase
VLGLRLSAGVPATEIETWISENGDPLLSEDYGRWFEAGVLARENGRVRFTERGFLVSNEVLCRFV